MAARMYRRLAISLASALVLAALLSAAFALNFLSGVQSQSTDILFKVRSASGLNQAAQRIALVAIDDKSLEKLGYWVSWDRSYYVSVLQFLSRAKARTVALDVIFEQPKPGDEVLAAALSEAGMVVQPVAGSPNLPDLSRAGEVIPFRGLLAPQPQLASASAALGHANVLTDGDGAVRNTPLMIRVGQREHPSLALAAAALYLRRPTLLDAPTSTPYLRAVGRAIPVDPFYRMAINYVGKPSLPDQPSTFSAVSFLDILEGRADPALFRDKIVFVGLLGATGFADDYWVPTADATTGKMAGVEIHANAAATILSNYFLARQDEASTVGTVLLIALTCAALTAILPVLVAALGAGLLAAIYMVFAFAMFDRGVVMNVVYPQLSLLVAFLAVTVYRVVFEEAERRTTVKAMSQYLSPTVMQEVLKDPAKLGLSGEKREMTMLFSDVRGFTSLAEQLDPQQVVRLLNQYLDAMTEVVFRFGGVLDKYMGDGLMAFWGAPVRQHDHPARACDTALEMLQQLRVLQAKWKQEGIPELNVGIGINTGLVSVGNMGSSRRFDYTVIGDAVNLASRLEGANKEYGTHIVISEGTWNQARGAGFVARFLDVVTVKGKKEPVAIYELLGKDSGLDAKPEEMLDRYERAVELYRQRDWEAAEVAFAAVLELAPDDGASTLYLERCRSWRGNPPHPDWDGVYTLEHK